MLEDQDDDNAGDGDDTNEYDNDIISKDLAGRK